MNVPSEIISSISDLPYDLHSSCPEFGVSVLPPTTSLTRNATFTGKSEETHNRWQLEHQPVFPRPLCSALEPPKFPTRQTSGVVSEPAISLPPGPLCSALECSALAPPKFPTRQESDVIHQPSISMPPAGLLCCSPPKFPTRQESDVIAKPSLSIPAGLLCSPPKFPTRQESDVIVKKPCLLSSPPFPVLPPKRPRRQASNLNDSPRCPRRQPSYIKTNRRWSQTSNADPSKCPMRQLSLANVCELPF